MDMRMVVIVLVMVSSCSIAKKATLSDRITSLIPAVGYVRLLAGDCPGTKISTECQKLTNNNKQESSCCPTCDLLWPPVITAYQEVVKDPTPANLFLASTRTTQLAALAVAGSAGSIPFVGDVAANPSNAVVTGLEMILPEHISDDIKCMREQFAVMKDQMSQMENRIRKDIKDLNDTVIAQKFYSGYMTWRIKLSNLRHYFDDLQHAITNGTCSQRNRNCEAVGTWEDHCNVINAGNQDDPKQLMNELHTLITQDFLGERFLESAANDKKSLQFLFKIYNTISNDIVELNMLNIRCGVVVETKEDLVQRLNHADIRVAEIKKTLMDFLISFIQEQVKKDTQRLIKETAEFNNWNDLTNALKAKRTTKHGPLITKYNGAADIAITKIFPFFRTICLPYLLHHPRDADLEVNGEIYTLFSNPPDFQTASSSPDKVMRMSFDKTHQRIHLTDSTLPDNRAITTVCHTYIPEVDNQLVESVANNIEFWLCNVEHDIWRGNQPEKSGYPPKHAWKPKNPFCEAWKAQDEYFPACEKAMKKLTAPPDNILSFTEKDKWQDKRYEALKAHFGTG